MNGHQLVGLQTKKIQRAEQCELCRSGCFEDGSKETGECRKGPPQMQFIPTAGKMGQTVINTIAAWPNVTRNQWCTDGFQPMEKH